jgi:uncharacterized glyoxalase superfamily protein PhnB
MQMSFMTRVLRARVRVAGCRGRAVRLRSLVRSNEAHDSLYSLFPVLATSGLARTTRSGMPPKPIPEDFHTVTPHLVVRGGKQAVEFYQQAFGAELIGIDYGPDDNTVLNARLRIGNANVLLCDEFPGMEGWVSPERLGGSAVAMHIYTEDVDVVFQRALDAGAKPVHPPMDMFWGDRYAKVTDPFGHWWSIATHIEDVPPEQMQQRQAAFFKSFEQGES